MKANDGCGSSLTQIGDINHDQFKQHHNNNPRPLTATHFDSPSVVDLVMGCPQKDTGILPGRIFLLFLTKLGTHQSHTLIPGASDLGIAPRFLPKDQLGASLAGIQVRVS